MTDPTMTDRERAAACGFCKGKPVGDARSWASGERLPALPCPRCGVLTPYPTPKGTLTYVHIQLGWECRVERVIEGVAEIRDVVNEALDDERLIELHRDPDGALIAVDPVAVRLIEPAAADGWPIAIVHHDEVGL